MIIDLLARAVITVLKGVFALVPAYTVPQLPDLAASIGGYLGQANAYFPVTTCGVALSMILGVRVFFFGWRLVVFVYDRFPLKFT